MEAKELRIGNLYKTAYDIAEIKLGSDIDYADTYGKPIPLTEEWLIKFGFRSGKYKDFQIGTVEDDFVLEQFTIKYMNSFIKIKHVHQLQNFCFVFGEELTIKE